MTFMKEVIRKRLQWWPGTPESKVSPVPLHGAACVVQKIPERIDLILHAVPEDTMAP